MGNGEFDTTDASYTAADQLREALALADRVNGSVIRMCCALYKLAWEAGVDPALPDMMGAEAVLRGHGCWDETWSDGTGEQSPDGTDAGR